MNSPIDDKLTSGHHHSYWVDSVEPKHFETLQSDEQTEVVVIGGGIAGLSTAYCLVQTGKKVILIEDGYLGSGETGRTTAHISYVLDEGYAELTEIFGEEKAKRIFQSHLGALEWIEQVILDEKIDCNFKRVDAYLFTHPSDKQESLQVEFAAAQKIGLDVKMLEQTPGLPVDKSKQAVLFPQQGQFHSLKYLHGLAKAVIKKGGKIYTQTHAAEVLSNGVKANGYCIKAKHIVVATNSPINTLLAIHIKQFAYRTYAIASKVKKGTLPYAIWWDTGDQNSQWLFQPYHYARLEPLDSDFDLLIIGGEDHKTGQADHEHISELKRHEKLFAWAQQYFPDFKEIAYRWSGQVMEPVDALAFIGKSPGSDNVYMITGDSGNGITHGTIGGLLIADLINGKDNPYADLYNPARFPFRTPMDFIKEAGKMVLEMGQGWLTCKPSIEKSISKLKPGQGAILRRGFKNIAVYKDVGGDIYYYSAVCPHLGGILEWNDDEKSFDCPLHGSRFTPEGIVINGPANCGLKKWAKL